MLGGKGGVVKVDGKGDLEAVVRVESGQLVAFAHLNAAFYAHKTLGRHLFPDTGGLNQEHKGAGAAVHDGDFGCRHLDHHIVDAQTSQGRHEVLDGAYLYPVIIEQGGGHGGFPHREGAGDNIDRGIKIGTAENDAGIVGGRNQGQKHLLATVQTYPTGANGMLDGALT